MKKGSRGFSLIELMVALGVFSILAIALGGVLMQSMRIWEQGEDIGMVNASLRTAEMSIYEELAQATFAGIANPPVQGITLPNNPGNAITFQRPLQLDGTVWSAPITFRLRNEDVNQNLVPDAGEDVDGNGRLDRVVERLQDLDGDGAFNGPGETRQLANDIDALTFALVGQQVSVTMVGRRLVEGNLLQGDTLTFTVNLVN